MSFITNLLIPNNQKKDVYNFILVIVNKITQTINYKLVITYINTTQEGEIFINMVVRQYSFSKSVIRNKNALFTL